MPLITLTPEQHLRLHEALLAAFPKPENLSGLLRTIDKKYETSLEVRYYNFPDNVHVVIDAAERDGWLLQLVCAARDWVPGDAAFRQLSDELTPLVQVGAPIAPLDRPSPRIAWRPLPADLPATWLADMGGLPSLGAPGTLEVHILYTERSLRLESRRLAALRGELPDLGREAGLLPEDGCGLAVQPDGQRSAWQPLPADDLGAILDEDDLTERIATLLSTLACVNTQYSGEVGIAVGIATTGLLSEGRVADLPRTTPGTTERGWTSRRPVRVPARDALSFAYVDVRPHEVAAELASRLIAKFRESCP